MNRSRIAERLRTVPGLGRDTLTLAGVVVAGVVAAVAILAQLDAEWPWSGRVEYRVEVDEAVAVSPGNGQEVRIAGVPVGVITGAEPSDRGTALITVAVDREQVLYDNARAVLRPKNPLNEMYLSLDTGGPPGRPLADGGTIPVTQTSRPVQAEEVLSHLDGRSRAALTALLAESDAALASAPATLPAGLDATAGTLTGLRPVVEQLAVRRDNVRALVGSLSRVVAAVGRDDERLTGLLDSLQQTLDTLAARDDELAATLDQLPGLSADVRRALGAASTLTTELDPTLDDLSAASGELPGALARFTDTADALAEVARAATPVVREARPVVADLRPVVDDLGPALGDIRGVTRWADDATAQIAPWMYDLAAFVHHTNSVFGVQEEGGRSLGRGHLTIDLASPDGVDRDSVDGDPNGPGSFGYREGESPFGPYPAPGSGGPR